MTITKTRLNIIILAAFCVVITLLNQRQNTALFVALAFETWAIYWLLTSQNKNFNPGITIETILLCILPLALVSSISFYFVHVEEPLMHWIRLLFPILLVITVTRLLSTDIQNIDVLTIAFGAVLILSIYKVQQTSAAAEMASGWKRQVNWGNAVGSVSPFMLLIRRQWLKTIVLMLIFAGLIISLKRTAFAVAMVLGLVMLIPVDKEIRITRKTMRNISLGLCALLAGILYMYLKTDIGVYIERIIVRLSRLSSDHGSGRFTMWSNIYELMSNQSIYKNFIGHGYGWYHDHWREIGINIESLHNDFMQFWVSFGILGAILYIFILLRIAYLSIFVFKHCKEYARFGLSVFPIYFIYSMLAGTFFYFFFFVPLFVAIGCLEAIRYRKRLENKNLDITFSHRDQMT